MAVYIEIDGDKKKVADYIDGNNELWIRGLAGGYVGYIRDGYVYISGDVYSEDKLTTTNKE